MKKLLLLMVIAGLLIFGGFTTVQAQSQQTPPAAGKSYVLPVKITILNESVRETKDAEEVKLLEDLDRKNECVKVVKTPDGGKAFLVFCGTLQFPYCPPPPPGQPKRCF